MRKRHAFSTGPQALASWQKAGTSPALCTQDASALVLKDAATMPMPRKDDLRDIRFTMRLSTAEAAEYQRRADAAGCSLTAYARQAILGEFSVSAATMGSVIQDRGALPVFSGSADRSRRVRRHSSRATGIGSILMACHQAASLPVRWSSRW